jgi:hypothetical protein
VATISELDDKEQDGHEDKNWSNELAAMEAI